MYCNFNYNSNCCNCQKFVKSIKVTGDEANLDITVPEQTLCNCTTLCVCVAQPIPETVGKDSVLRLFVGGDEYPVVTPCSNFIYGDQMRAGKVYCFKFGTDTKAFFYRGGERLCRTKHEFTCIPIVPPPTKKAKPKAKVQEES